MGNVLVQFANKMGLKKKHMGKWSYHWLVLKPYPLLPVEGAPGVHWKRDQADP
jgi:hypothetical protein